MTSRDEYAGTLILGGIVLVLSFYLFENIYLIWVGVGVLTLGLFIAVSPDDYAGVLIFEGFALALSFVWLRDIYLMWVGVGVLTLGLLLLPSQEKSWYCAACGQYFGEGDTPEKCGRCGSNRFTDVDPGAGDAVRIKSDRRNHGRNR